MTTETLTDAHPPGAILTAILISSRDSREYSEAARAEAPAVPLGTG
jgi:hypothetical protein